MLSTVGLATLAFFLVDNVNAQGVAASSGGVINLDITNENVSPDGFNRSAVLAGGTLPGPLISGRKGSRFRINVRNDLKDREMLKTTSIHWQGMFQDGTPWADGPTFVSQCPIASGHSFLYDFSPAKQTNTFWYHSHHELQYCDGLRGPMVIYDDQDPHRKLYDVDNDNTIITLMDWFHVPAARIVGPASPDSTLINGKGRYVGGPADHELSVVNVEKGKRYRMRLISLACDANYNFTIDGHKLQVIETDGINTRATWAEAIHIFAAQRYSFVLHANQTIGNYWIRANPNIGTKGFEGGINSAILRYKDAPTTGNGSQPTTEPSPDPKFVRESTLAPLNSPAAPGKPKLGAADINLRLVMGQNFSINGTNFVPPSVPVLLQVLSGTRSAQDLLPTGSVYTLEKNKVVEITLTGSAPGGPHPFHLHGHTFSIVKGADDNEPNFINPPRRDVVQSGQPNSEVVLRFKTDNAGPWLFHCHIEFHLQAGLAVVFAEDTRGTRLLNDSAPKAWKELCPIYEELTPGDL